MIPDSRLLYRLESMASVHQVPSSDTDVRGAGLCKICLTDSLHSVR
jgi:hypothetical protein